jgi:pimeloyl-ACP methyl ester carboxylesterase
VPAFDSDGVSVHYETYGDGPPLVLVHGFASSLDGNWVRPGWTDTLSPLRRVIALDCRGHGSSGKPHDAAAYQGGAMAGDVLRLMDHLGVDGTDLFGYSMGGRISLQLLTSRPERFRSVVLGGVGEAGTLRRRSANIAAGLLAADASTIEDPVAKGFRVFAEASANDLEALAACMRSQRPIDAGKLREVRIPALIVVGEDDAVIGRAEGLAALMPGARLLTLSGRDHLTAVGDQRFKDAVVAFLSAQD